jgi:hypothetical protein
MIGRKAVEQSMHWTPLAQSATNVSAPPQAHTSCAAWHDQRDHEHTPRPAEQRMYATLLAQPRTWARFTQARCAASPPTLHACQQRCVMPTFGGPSCVILYP